MLGVPTGGSEDVKNGWVLIFGTGALGACIDLWPEGEPPEFDSTCESCRADGQSCEISYNCPFNSICNLAHEEYFDESQPLEHCIKTYCSDDADCDAGASCAFDRRCSTVCQIDADCGAGACFDGRCSLESLPQDVQRCVFLSRDDALSRGAEKILIAAALDSGAKTLSHVRFVFTSSDPAVAAASGEKLIGGAVEGFAEITAATESGVPCEGSIRVQNYLPVTADDTRVIVLDELGRPVTGATVLLDDGTERVSMTGARGAVLFSRTTTISVMSISAPGHDFLTVLEPGGRDLIFELPRAAIELEPTGFGGSVTLAPETRRDIAAGLAGAPLTNNPFGFDLATHLCNEVDTRVNLPELGFDDALLRVLSGQVFRYGKKVITDDSAIAGGGARCRGVAPKDGELGCYLAASPPGPVLSWAFAGNLRFSRVSQLGAARMAAPTCEASPIDDLGRLERIMISPLAHGVGVAVGAAPFSQTTLAITAPKAIYSAIALPDLPDREPDGMDTVFALAGVNVPDQGLIPLGTASGFDDGTTAARDGRTDAVEEPFGERSIGLPAGQIPLSMSPPHGVLAGHPLSLIALAFPHQTTLADASSGLSAIVRTLPRVESRIEIGAAFLALQHPRYNSATRTIALAPSAGASLMVRVEAAGRVWRIYSPGGRAQLSLPAASFLPEPFAKMRFGEYETTVPYADHFRLGSPSRPKDALSSVTRFAIEDAILQ